MLLVIPAGVAACLFLMKRGTARIPDDTMPLLSITTLSDDDNIEFVTRPIAPYVARGMGLDGAPEPYYQKCRISLKDPNGDMVINDAGANVRVRGNWTTGYDKKPLKIKFDEKQKIPGLNGGARFKSFVLLAGFKDSSMLRDKVGLFISRRILGNDGLYAADSELVEVEINGRYWGVYLLTEQQQVKKNRIEITEAAEEYTEPDIGYLLEMDAYYREEDELHSFVMGYYDNSPLKAYDDSGEEKYVYPIAYGSDLLSPDVGITIKSDIFSAKQHDFIESYLNNVYDIMYAAAYLGEAYCFNSDYTQIYKTDAITPREAVEKVVDVYSLADMYLISELTCDKDLGWSSFFMDVDFGKRKDHRLRFEAPWDFDSSMGNRDVCPDGTGLYAAGVISHPAGFYTMTNPWLTVLMYEDWYRDIIIDRWRMNYESGVFEDALEMIDKDTYMYEDAFISNSERWGSYEGNELSEAAMDCRTQKEAAMYLKDWLTRRIEFLNDHWG